MARSSYRRGPDFKHYHIKDERDKRRTRILFLLEVSVVIAAAFFAVFFFGHRTNVTGDAMAETISDGDTVLINRLKGSVFPIEREDVIAFFLNGEQDSYLYVRRVVGVPGDTVQIEDGILYVNGEEAQTVFEDEISVAGLAKNEIVLGEDEYFVLGDNPDESEDSRHANIGTVNRSEIYGTVWLRLLPLNRIGLI